jgi:transposase
VRPRKSFPRQAAERLEKLLTAAGSDAERRRIQCVYLRARYGYGVERIAEETGLKLQTVRNIHSAYLKEGEACLKLSGRGGRKNFNLSFKAEAALLAGFAEQMELSCVEISEIHAAYQRKAAKKTALTTTYRILHRHGWRKRFGPRSGLWSAPKKDVVK